MVIDRQAEMIKELTEQAVEMMSDWPSSREKQRQFVLAYMASGFKNATEAARLAGYSVNSAKGTANKLLTLSDFSHVQEVISKLKQVFDERSTELSVASLLEIKQFHTRVLRGEEKDYQLVGVGMGEQVVKKVPASLRERQKSADSLARMVDPVANERALAEVENLKAKNAGNDTTESVVEGYLSKLEDVIDGLE